MRWTRKKTVGGILLLGLAVVLAVSCQPSVLVFNAWLHDRHDRADAPAGTVDDASRLNETRVAEVVQVPTEPEAAEQQLRSLLQRARVEKLGVSIAGAKHSMGGHVIAPDGIVLDMLPLNRLEFDAQRQVLHAGGGARWAEVIPFLNERGFAPYVMQSNNDFSIGGSLSVNCHGWQTNYPPIAPRSKRCAS